MSLMEAKESIERYNEAMKKAVSRAHELGVTLHYAPWLEIAKSLENLRITGMDLAASKSLSKGDLDSGIKEYQNNIPIISEAMQ